MATISFEVYSDVPSWQDMGANRLVFSGSLTDLNTTINATTFNDGTHLGDGTPGADICGTQHVPNVKLLTSTTMSKNGASSATINDTNLLDTDCTFRIHFNDAAGYSLQNGRLYCYDGVTTTVPAIGVDAAVYVKSESMTTWQTINSDTIAGPSVSGESFTTAGIGGDNVGSYRSLNIRSANTDHFYYVAMSASPETSGGKSSYAVGCYLEYY